MKTKEESQILVVVEKRQKSGFFFVPPPFLDIWVMLAKKKTEMSFQVKLKNRNQRENAK